MPKVFRRHWSDARIYSAVHAKKGDDVHLEAGDIDVDVGLLAQLSEMAYLLDVLVSIEPHPAATSDPNVLFRR